MTLFSMLRTSISAEGRPTVPIGIDQCIDFGVCDTFCSLPRQFDVMSGFFFSILFALPGLSGGFSGIFL